MDQDLKRISSGLKLPPESRERIRARLASCQDQKEDIPVKKGSMKPRIPLIAAAVVMAMALTLTAGAISRQFFRNDIIVDCREEIPDPADNSTAPGWVVFPIPKPPSTLEKMIESNRFKSDGWSSIETIDGGMATGYFRWDGFELLDSTPALRSRRVTREDGAEKLEYTAENPVSLVDTLTGHISFDLSWMGQHYDYVPDANFSYVITDPKGSYVEETLGALYVKPDESAYVQLTFDNTAEYDGSGLSYVISGSFEVAYYYTNSDGYEFLIQMDNGNVWASCRSGHSNISLYGAYLTEDEIEDILDNLSLFFPE